MLKKLSILITGHDLGKYRPGIGPNSWGYWRLLIPFQGRFFNAGESHDLEYSRGYIDDDKKLADYEFLETTLEASGKNPFAILFSCIYYILLANFGYKFFNYEKTSTK